MATMHHLDRAAVKREWTNALRPRLVIDPGDTAVCAARDAADGYYAPSSTHADVLARGPFRGHPLTGPVSVRGARGGDVLTVEILDVKPAAAFGWTAIRPGRGLLPEAEFSKPHLTIWDLTDGTHARMGGRIAVPTAPFPGVMGSPWTSPDPTARCRPGRTAATWTSSSSPPERRSFFRSGWTAPCSASATRTPRRATARCASRRSR